MAGPLAGIRVLELAHVMAGPYGGMQLADFGADVIKIEKIPGGDDIRRAIPPVMNGESASFLAVNRNKRGLALDLKAAEGRDLFLRLVDTADVVLENMRPGAMAKLGLDYEALSARKPNLIYAALSGFGQTGPYAHRRGFDLVAQAMSGLMSVTGNADAAPTKVGVPICDMSAGLFLAFGILAALLHRERTGEGQMVDTSLFEAGIAYTPWESAIYWSDGTVPTPFGSAHRINAPYQAYRAADAWFVIGAATQPNWDKLCTALERRDLAADSRFADNGGRMAHLDALNAILSEILAAEPVAVWLERLEAAGVPAGPIQTIAQLWDDPQAQARGMHQTVNHPTAGDIPAIGVPVKLSKTPGQVRTAAPVYGQHSSEILAEIGVDESECRRLHDAGVIIDGRETG